MCEGQSNVQEIIAAPWAAAKGQSLDGRLKVLIAGWALVANVAAGSAVSSLLLAMGALVVVTGSGMPARRVIRRLVAPWYFALVAFAVQLFLSGHTPLFQVGPLLATEEGLARGTLLASKVIGGGAIVLALSVSTPLTELLAAAAWLRVPPVLIEIAALLYRYLFLLAEEAERIREAQTTRLGYAGWRRALSSHAAMAGLVLLNAYGRAERVYEAMLLRGYAGAMPLEASPMSRRQLMACLQLTAVIVAIFLLGMAL
jgi:cobalt/nickel transport system permease protein